MSNIQDELDRIFAAMRETRSKTQMTLKTLAERLAELPPETPILLGGAHSYRGYYSDIAFERVNSTAGNALRDVVNATNTTFSGYKGGDFFMDPNTPVWVANYSQCGKKLVGIRDDGTLETKDDE